MLVLSVLLYIVLAFVIYLGFNKNFTLARFLQTFFIVASTGNVLNFEVLNLFKTITSPWLFLILQLIICALISTFIILKRKASFKSNISSLRALQFSRKPIDWVMVIFICALLCGFLIVGLTTPPNNSDSLDPTRLQRVYYWVQENTLDPVDSADFGSFIKPINGLLQGLWLFLLGRSENLFFLLQWFSLVIVIFTIYDISQALGFSSTASLFSCAVSVSLPVAILQSYSFQMDLYVAALVCVFISLTLSFLKNKSKATILAAILCLGLALGTKNTAFLVLPVVGVTAFILILKSRNFKKILPWIVVTVVILFLVTGSHFIKNIVNTGHLFGTESLLMDPSSVHNFGEKAAYNVPRYVYRFIGFDGLPKTMQTGLTNGKATVFKSIYDSKNIDLNSEKYQQPGSEKKELFNYLYIPQLTDDESWFGPLAFLLLPTALFITFFSKNRFRREYAFFVISLFIVYFILVLLQRAGWDQYQGRYFLVVVLPFLPLVSIIIPERGWVKHTIISIVFVFSFVLSVFTFVSNDSKPLITRKTIENIQNEHINVMAQKSPLGKKIAHYIPMNMLASLVNQGQGIYSCDYLDQVYYYDRKNAQILLLVSDFVPPQQEVYYSLVNRTLAYGLYGKNRTRDIYQIFDVSEIKEGYFLTDLAWGFWPSQNVKLLGKIENYSFYYIGDNPPRN